MDGFHIFLLLFCVSSWVMQKRWDWQSTGSWLLCYNRWTNHFPDRDALMNLLSHFVNHRLVSSLCVLCLELFQFISFIYEYTHFLTHIQCLNILFFIYNLNQPSKRHFNLHSVKLGWEFDCSCWFCLSWLVPSPTLSLLPCPWPPPSSSDFLCVVLTVLLGGRVGVVQWYLFAEVELPCWGYTGQRMIFNQEPNVTL